MWAQSTTVTGGRTDEQTSGFTITKTALRIGSRGKMKLVGASARAQLLDGYTILGACGDSILAPRRIF